MPYLRTSDLARAVGVHPNTVRRYTDRGILPPVVRGPAGYRRFTRRHLDSLRLAHLVYGSRFPGKAIRQLGARIVQTATAGDLPAALSADEQLLAEPALVPLHEGIARLAEVGADYLSLGRASPTLSAGEAQRLRLASLLGSSLSGVLYVFDEPIIGLHLADTARLLGVLQRLVDAATTVLVVEHNLDVIKAADWVIDLGPEGGAAGGKLIAEGTPEQVARVAASYTGHSLRETLHATALVG